MRPPVFWASAPGTKERKAEEKILREMGLLEEAREGKMVEMLAIVGRKDAGGGG
jgi:hypothetical protein